MGWKIEKLRKVIGHRKEFITIDNSVEYKRCRVQVNRKGVILRDIIKGVAINTKKQQVCKEGDFLVAEIDAKVGGYGFVGKDLEGAIVSSHYFLFEVDETKLLKDYLFWLTKTDIIQDQISSKGSTNYAAIRPHHVLDFAIPLPSIPEQAIIINRLNNIDKEYSLLNNELRQQQTYLQLLRQTTLQEAVQGKLTKQDPTDEPATELLKRIKAEKDKLIKAGKLKKEKELPPITADEIPFALREGWVWSRLGDIIKISSGDGLTASQMAKDGKIPVYGGNGINGYHNEFNVAERTIVIGRVGFYCGSVHHTEEKAWVTDNAFITRFSEENLDRGFLFQLLKATDLKQDDRGTAQPVISGRKVYPLIVALPPIAEQRRIVAKLHQLQEQLSELETQVQQSRQYAQQLLQSILKEAFEEKRKIYEMDEEVMVWQE